MRQLIISLICLVVGMGSAGYGQGISASRAPGPAMARSSGGQTATVAPSPATAGSPTGKHVGHHPAKRQTVQSTPAARIHHGSGTGANTTPKPARQPVISYAEALRRCRHERHDRAWWKSRYTTIVFVATGYYYWDAGYWYPAWGYDPFYDTYDYDGPIYTYGDLLPDQVIINVQRALKELGYYGGGLTGSLGPSTRAALAAYQEDAGLAVTGAIDAPTVEGLGLE